MSDFTDNFHTCWPERAVVTAGMPYGNKPLHFGHIGGVFVPADTFARFLRDRIGSENVCFVSGTDCFGSPIDEGYRKLVDEGGFNGSIADYVMQNHEKQKDTLKRFLISLDIFEGSGIGYAGEVHQEISDEFITRLYENGWLKKTTTMQFFDVKANTFLNGRQVVGRMCPVQGCKAEHAYADECDMGHQYNPVDLIDPISTLTGDTPEMRPVENWYFNLPAFASFSQDYVKKLTTDPAIRPVVTQTILEFLAPPIIFIKNDEYEKYLQVVDELPAHEYRAAEAGKASFEIEFATIDKRDEARDILSQVGIRFRTSKTLVPFRMTGNIDWGVKAPVLEGLEGLTIWCWPESLWAPISFTCALMAERENANIPHANWADFWCGDTACVYQFIGQDNLYFYGVVQPALWEALNPTGLEYQGSGGSLRQTKLIANHHLLFGKKKASSSGDVKPPTGEELLDHYTVEQLRAHFLALGLDQKSVGFAPKPFDPNKEKRDDPRVADPVLKESALLTNVFNRLARSCFYEAQNNFDNGMPLGKVTDHVVERAQDVLRNYDALMYKVELHSVMSLVDEFIRWANKYWASEIKEATQHQDICRRKQILLDSFYLLRISCLMMHPIVPHGCETICEKLNFKSEQFFCWNYGFASNDELCLPEEISRGFHPVCELPARFDFFRKHESQYK